MKRPAASAGAPPRKPKRRLSPNAALIAGVGTLLLAMGVGVLIGRSGHDSGATGAAPAQQVIKVEGGGATETASAATGATGKSSGSKSSKPSKKSAKKAEARAESGAGAEEVLKPSGNVDLPESTVQPGDACKESEAGCENGKFNGSFFGE